MATFKDVIGSWEKIDLGSYVRINERARRADLRGCEGKVVSYNDVSVQLDDRRVVRLKPSSVDMVDTKISLRETGL